MPTAAELQKDVLAQIDEARQLRPFGLVQFCRKVPCSADSWYRWERNRASPNLRTIYRMAQIVDRELHVAIVTPSSVSTMETPGMPRSLEAREVALLMERMTPEQRQYVVQVARAAVAIPFVPPGSGGPARR